MSYIRSIVGILVPCPTCGHRNKVARGVKETVRLVLLDQLPCCKKCQNKIDSACFDLTGVPYVNMLRRELGLV